MKNRYYTRTFAGLSLVLLALLAAAWIGNSLATEARRRHEQVLTAARTIEARSALEREKVQQLRKAMSSVRAFATAWKSVARLAEKDAAERMRSEIENVAQRQLALVTDNAITPEPEKFAFQGDVLRVQKVTLRASGKDLAALLTWLGKVEEKYPAAVVECCDFSSNVGGSTGLTVRLVQPLADPKPARLALLQTPETLAALPEMIRAIEWTRYLPERVKAACAVGFQRNPLQPAVMAEQRLPHSWRDDTDEIRPRIEAALDGHVRSVIRGVSPIVVVDGRVFRVGDEILVGKGREKLMPDTKTKLKHVDDDRLMLQVSGGTADRPILCDVAYDLPSFLRAR